MSASIAHMLLSRKVREELERIDHELWNDLQKYQRYMELGAVGPDLPYYENIVKAGIEMLFDSSDKPMGVDPWSYQLHSKTPNLFPLKLIEITWREANPEFAEWEEDDRQKFAFTCGFLTHMAVDQIIHPLVNKVAGPYYKSGDHRKVHRQCEVYQDVVIYQKLNPGKSLLDDDTLYLWCDPNRDGGNHTEQWFRYFLQKTFIEAHSVSPNAESIENWVRGIIITLRGLNKYGFYVDAANDFDADGINSESYKKYYGDTNYEKSFQDAIDLALIYVKTAFALYNIDHLSKDERRFFLEVVQDADLSAPLQKDIYASAKNRFDAGINLKTAPQAR